LILWVIWVQQKRETDADFFEWYYATSTLGGKRFIYFQREVANFVPPIFAFLNHVLCGYAPFGHEEETRAETSAAITVDVSTVAKVDTACRMNRRSAV
jgi:hypothetical protein